MCARGTNPSPRLSAWIDAAMLAMVAVPAAITLRAVSSPGTLQVATSNPTMYSIHWSDGSLARQEPSVLNEEIVSIHRVFPHTPILVIGHSNGGLIA